MPSNHILISILTFILILPIFFSQKKLRIFTTGIIDPRLLQATSIIIAFLLLAALKTYEEKLNFSDLPLFLSLLALASYKLLSFFDVLKTSKLLYREPTTEHLFNPPKKEKKLKLEIRSDISKPIYRLTQLTGLFFLSSIIWDSKLFSFLSLLTSFFLLYLSISKIEINTTSSGLKELKMYLEKENLASLKPRVIFYFSAPDESSLSHLQMWLPYLNMIEIPFYILVREKKYISKLKDLDKKTPIVLAESISELEFFICETVNVILYANNGTKNTHMVRYNHLWHIQLLHGDSEKPPSYNPISKMYDKLFVAGQRAIDRYYENGIKIPRDNFEIIGRPQISSVVSKKQKSDDENLYILIAPTWAGFNEDAQFSTLHYLPELISSIISLKKNNIRFIFRPHPYSLDNDTENKKTIAAIKKILSNHSPENIALSKNSIYEDFNTSDLLITDISSVPIDYLASGKPIIHLDIHNLKERALNDSRFKKYIPCTYLIEKDLSNIDDIITEIMLEDSLSSLRNDVCKYYLGYPPLKSIDVFTTQIRKYVEKEKPINSYSESQPSPHMS